MEQKVSADFIRKTSIRYTIFIYFTVSALVTVLLIGIVLYMQMSRQLTMAVQEENQAVLGQINRSVDSYLRTIMKLSDSLYYGVIKNADLDMESINSQITLLYDNNKDSIANIALLSKEGTLLEAVPAARLKTGLDVTEEQWFGNTLERTDNLHFTTPHVQYIFDNSENQYRWVITLTRAVEITHGTSTEQGILLLDIRYSSLQQILENITLNEDIYLVGVDALDAALNEVANGNMTGTVLNDANGQAAGAVEAMEALLGGKTYAAGEQSIYVDYVKVTPDNVADFQ